MAKELQNLRADAIATLELLHRRDDGPQGRLALVRRRRSPARRTSCSRSRTSPATLAIGENGEPRLSLDALVDRIVDLIITREKRGKHYGTVVLAEGLAEMLPDDADSRTCRATSTATCRSAASISASWSPSSSTKRYEEKTGRKKKVTGLQLGYESRCAPPHAFDVMLGSQLGIGAYRALVEENLDGHMVSVDGPARPAATCRSRTWSTRRR